MDEGLGCFEWERIAAGVSTVKGADRAGSARRAVDYTK
jgi:hypothetical protein